MVVASGTTPSSDGVGSGAAPDPPSLTGVRTWRRPGQVGAIAALVLTASLAPSCTGDDRDDGARASTTVASVPGAEAAEEMAALGASLLEASGARSSVRTGGDAEAELAELARTYCSTARRSDLGNASATFRYSLSAFFGRHGAVPAAGEPQDATLALAMLAGTWGEAIEAAARDQICPDVR